MARRRLSRQQRERIRAIQARRRAQLARRADRPQEQNGKAIQEPGVVITRHGQNLVVEDEQGDLHHCLSRQNIGDPVCGDRVAWQRTGEREGVVTAILERDSVLIRPTYSGEVRPLAANITQLVVVLAPLPPPSPYLLDQYLVAAEQIGVPVLIALNKKDLMDAAAIRGFEQDFGLYEDIGYPLIRISALHEHGLDPLVERLRDQTSILVGQSGTGKSSLVKALLPDRDIQVGRLSEASGLGRHTTSATTLYRLPQGGALIDSPGVRSFRLGRLDRHRLERGFREFAPFLGHCRFSDCSHRDEPGCALRQAVAAGEIHPRRLANFLHMAQEMEQRRP